MSADEKYEVFLRVSESSDDRRLYVVEHWFVDRPGAETVKALLDEARRDYSMMYPEAEPDDFSVEVRRLRPSDTHRVVATTSIV